MIEPTAQRPDAATAIRRLAVRPAASVAPWRAGSRDRPLGGIPQSPADVAAAHPGLGRRVPLGQARQRHAHRSPATAHPAGPWPAGTFHRPGLGQPPAAPVRRRYTLGPGTGQARHRVRHREATGSWLVKEQLRALLATGFLADAAAAKNQLQALVVKAAQPETNRLWRTVCRWWKEIEVLIVTGATTTKVEPTTPR